MFPLFIDLKCRTIGTSRATAEKFYYDQRYISFLRSETTKATNVDPNSPRKPSATAVSRKVTIEPSEEEEEEEDISSQAPAVEVPPAGTSGVTSSVQMEEDELVSEEEESINLDQRFEMEMNEMRRHEVQTLTTLPPQTLTTLPPQTLTIPKEIDTESRDGTPETVTPPPEPGDVTPKCVSRAASDYSDPSSDTLANLRETERKSISLVQKCRLQVASLSTQFHYFYPSYSGISKGGPNGYGTGSPQQWCNKEAR